jgi:galactokinase
MTDVWLRVRAPGRVNLIGEHTDYAGGLALPMAIDRETTIVGRAGHDRIVLVSDDEAEPAEVGVDGDLADQRGWARYVAGVAAELQLHAGFIGAVTTSIPIGAGLSSSAALEVAVALSLLGPAGAHDVDRVALAVACQRAEHRASGVPCGAMDQIASLCGVAGHAVLVDSNGPTATTVPLPDDVAIVVIDSGERRRLATSGYAARREEVRRAAELLGPLRSAALDDVASIDDAILRRRARHVVTENERVRSFIAAMAGDDLEAAGALLNESHRSLRDDHEVSTPGIDRLVEQLCATHGVYGARITGGGWGGCVVALAEPGAIDGGWTVSPADGASVEAR